MAELVKMPPPGRRERKKAETRQRIRRAALELARARGVEHLTIEEISESADIAPRTFFNYFECKEDALVADSRELAQDLCDAIGARPATEAPLRALREAILQGEALRSAPQRRAEALARYRLVKDNPSLLPRHLHQFGEAERAIEATMRARIGSSSPDDLRPALLAAIGMTVLRLVTHRWASDDNASLPTLINSTFDLLEHGVD